MSTLAQARAVGAFRHQVDAIPVDPVCFDQPQHFRDVLWPLNHKLEPRFRFVCPGGKTLGIQGDGRIISGMFELGADIVLRDQRGERGVRFDRTVGLDLHADARQEGYQPRQRRALQQRFAPGDHQPVLP